MSILTFPTCSSIKTPLVPTGDKPVSILAQTAAAAWKQDGITLKWMTAEAFEKKSISYAQELSQQTTSKAAHKPVVQNIQSLNEKINEHLEYLKGYIREKYTKAKAPAYYPDFGFVKDGDTFMFPLTREERRDALQMLLTAIPKHGFQDKDYGLSFWKDLVKEYATLSTTAKTAKSSIADTTSTKNQLKEELRKVLQALVYAIKANYPDNSDDVLRKWGF